MRGINTITLLLLIITMFCSCHAQDDTRVMLKNSDTQEPTPISTSEYTDPLFFIEGQLCQHVREIYQDSNGNLWFGTNVYDLMMFNGDSLVYISEEDGYGGGRVTGIEEDSEGILWIATSSGLHRYVDETFSILDEKSGLSNAEIWSMAIDSKGTIWIGHNEGLSRYDGETFTEVSIPKPSIKEPNSIYSQDRITAIAEGRGGVLWFGTDGYGVVRYDGETFTHYTSADGLADDTINDLKVDGNGFVWIGTYFGGLSMYDGIQMYNYTTEGTIEGAEVGGIYVDNDHTLWFAAENNGVYRFNGKEFFHYHTDAGLEGSILSIYRDNQDRFWFGGWGGLFRMIDGKFTPVTIDGPWK